MLFSIKQINSSNFIVNTFMVDGNAATDDDGVMIHKSKRGSET